MLLNGYVPPRQWERMTALARTCFVNEVKRYVSRMKFDRMTPIDGVRFGRLVAIRRNGVKGVVVECDCGMVKTVYLSALMSGSVRSCGCLRAETARRTAKATGAMNFGRTRKRAAA